MKLTSTNLSNRECTLVYEKSLILCNKYLENMTNHGVHGNKYSDNDCILIQFAQPSV